MQETETWGYKRGQRDRAKGLHPLFRQSVRAPGLWVPVSDDDMSAKWCQPERAAYMRGYNAPAPTAG